MGCSLKRYIFGHSFGYWFLLSQKGLKFHQTIRRKGKANKEIEHWGQIEKHLALGWITNR
jgi:hypothetical protein